MIIYSATKDEFANDTFNGRIVDMLRDALRDARGWSTSPSEINAWTNSLQHMDRVMADRDIPGNAGVCIEYTIPASSKRVDFIVSGRDRSANDQAVIVELKQWSRVEHTGKDGIVSTFVGGGDREVSHPSYQAWSYASLLAQFNQAVYDGGIGLHPCAFLHNLESESVSRDDFYADYLSKAPVFLQRDASLLRSFIKDWIHTGDHGDVVKRIESGPIRPSKALADSLATMIKGKPEFVLIDEQKLVYETARTMAKKAFDTGRKQVLIVKGGPGTGKSVVAINLLVSLTNAGMNARYVSKNAAPRAVYASRLAGTLKKTVVSNLFIGSGAFTECEENAFDALIVDEAHRLNEKSGLYRNLGENQILELVRSSRFCVFFIDEDQKVTFDDIGDIQNLRNWARKSGTETTEEMELASQFRCNGSDGYLAWVDNALQIRETANTYITGFDYDFRVFDDPGEMFDAVRAANETANKARMVAGYCWDWVSKKNPNRPDITFPHYGFEAKWNLATDGNLWAIAPTGVNEIGCIHTCQGLEMETVGVIVGPDLLVRDGIVVTNGFRRASTDKSLRGFKTLHKSDPEAAKRRADSIIRNTYRTLMTRGQKACFVFSEDAETRDHFRQLTR